MGKQGKKKARARSRNERKSSGGGQNPAPPPEEEPLPDLPAAPTHAPGSGGGGGGGPSPPPPPPPGPPPPRGVPGSDPAIHTTVKVEDVASLPLAAHEIWQVLLADGFVLVGDATDALWGSGSGMRPLLAGPLPDLSSPAGRSELAGLLLGAMARPRDGEEAPRRPARVLMDPSFPPGTVEAVRAEVTGPAGVRVEGGASEDVLSAVSGVLYQPSLAECSWGTAARGAHGAFGVEGGAAMLLAGAMCLPRRDDEVWTCGVFLVSGPLGDRPHLVVERVDDESPPGGEEEGKERLLVGGGPVPVALVHHALLAAMRCPLNGEKRRPGKIVFQPNLAGNLGSYQGTMKELGVEVLLGTG